MSQSHLIKISLAFDCFRVLASFLFFFFPGIFLFHYGDNKCYDLS